MKAPVSEFLWYLAVFRRTFLLMERSFEAGDLEAMWLSQWAAELLHNVPQMLRDYDTQGYNTPHERKAQLAGFPHLIRRLDAPISVSLLAESVVSRSSVSADLGLAEDLSDLDLAPEAALNEGLHHLYELCLDTRQRMPRQAIAEEGWAVTEHYGWNNRILAAVEKELPCGLVHWSQFSLADSARQLAEARSRLKSWSESNPE